MTIKMSKFGYVLTSRQGGREAFAAFLPTLNGVSESDEIKIDFDGVNSFSPSWGDEFLTPLIEKYGNRLVMAPTKNQSVILTLEMLEEINGIPFKKL